MTEKPNGALTIANLSTYLTPINWHFASLFKKADSLPQSKPIVSDISIQTYSDCSAKKIHRKITL